MNKKIWGGLSALILVTGVVLAADKVTLHIAAKSMGDALNEFGQQSGLHVVLFSELGTGLVAPRLEGAFTPEEALERLLANTGLRYKYIDTKTVAVLSAEEPGEEISGYQGSAEQRGTGEIRLAQAETETTGSAGAAGAPEPAPGASSQLEELEEIVVTAQKRKERLTDVPISISVVSGDDLDRLTTEGVIEALTRVPGVSTTMPSTIGGGAQLTVRGVSAGASHFNGSSPIAYYIDSVPFGFVKSAIAPDANAYDLERVEVLRGPQGTLYGASAQSGVVRILTKDPSFDAFEWKGRTTGSATDNGGENYRADLAVNVPLIAGKLAARATLGYENLAGWIDNAVDEDVNDAEVRNLRLKVNGQPTSAFSVGLLAWLYRSDSGAPSTADDNQNRSSPLDEAVATDYSVYGLKAGYEASGYSITSMTSYIDYRSETATDALPFFGVPFMTHSLLDSSVFTEEVNVSSQTEGPWRWTLGGIYRDAEDLLVQRISPPFPNFTDKSESFAVFGELTRRFGDGRFELTGGLRYFEDEVTQIENEPQTNDPDATLLPPDTNTFSKTSPRLVFAWHPLSDATVYVSYAEGFRSGFNQNANVIRANPAFPPVKADNLKNYEVGAKGTMAAGRFSYDAAIYFMDWDDVQQTLSVSVGGIPSTAPVNGGPASGVGLEFATLMRPVEGLELGVNFGFNDLESDGGAVPIGTGFPLFEKGDRLNNSSEYTAGASADYSFAMGPSGYRGRLSASGNYYSHMVARSAFDPGFPPFLDEGEGAVLARASFSVEAPQGWVATAFAENIGNEDPRGTGVFLIPDWVQRVRPRTIGLQLEYRFR